MKKSKKLDSEINKIGKKMVAMSKLMKRHIAADSKLIKLEEKGK